jgi:uncharacterized protein YjeT (DUF2065 family)
MTTPALAHVRDLDHLRLASLFEGVTLLTLLAVAVPLKHVAGLLLAVSIAGPVHGLAFLVYDARHARRVDTGLCPATQGAWFGNRWLMMKLGFVIALTALHGMLAGRLQRRMESGVSNNPPRLNFTLAGLFGLTAGIVVLVVVKPF